MRQWVIALVAMVSQGCAGSSDPNPSPLHKLCMDACAYVHSKNCLEKPAVNVGDCINECTNVQAVANSPCTDEQAAYYECTKTATIRCASVSGASPTVIGCEAEEQALAGCDSPTITCLRSPGSDDTCFKFGFSSFFTCSDGVSPGPECVQVTNSGFCCP